MDDERLLIYLYKSIYEKGGCDDIGVMMNNEHGIVLNTEKVHKLYRMAVSTGYVKEDSYAYGNHPHLSLTDKGLKYMISKKHTKAFNSSNKDVWKIIERASYIATIIGVLIALISWLLLE